MTLRTSSPKQTPTIENPPTRRPELVIGLDLLRILAASLVVFYHFGFWHLTAIDNTLARYVPGDVATKLMSFTHFGWVGVEIFFLISGYVITITAEGSSAETFARNRFLRLAPAVWICAPLTFLLYALALHNSISVLIPNFLRTIFFFPLFGSIDGVYWTLGVEISFYMLIFASIRWNWRKNVDLISQIIGLVSLCFWITCNSLSQINNDTLLFWLHKVVAFRIFQLLLFQHGCFFALGMQVMIWQKLGYTKKRLFVVFALIIACWLEIIGQNGIIERASVMPLPVWPALAVWTGAFSLLCLSIRYNGVLRARLGSSVSVVRKAGLLTYPLYLIHNPLGIAAIVLLLPQTGLPLAATLGLLIAVLGALIISQWWEPKLRGTLKRLWRI